MNWVGSWSSRPTAARSFAVACLVTIGGTPVSHACTSLMEIKRPLAAVFGFLLPPTVPLGPARHSRATLNARARATCVRLLTHPQFRLPPARVDAGVVRDRIATVEVYQAAGHGKLRLVTTVSVHNNVFVFKPRPREYGFLTLRSKSAGGRPVSATPLHTYAGTAVSTVVGVPSSGPGGNGRANIPLLGSSTSRP